jgi:hypothetical protein
MVIVRLVAFWSFEAITKSAWDSNFQSLKARFLNWASDGKVCGSIR